MLMGCSNKVKTTEENQEINLNHEELMEGNFSSIAGEYINLQGESIFINDEGYQSDEVIGHEVYYNGSVYFRNISSKLDGYEGPNDHISGWRRSDRLPSGRNYPFRYYKSKNYIWSCRSNVRG